MVTLGRVEYWSDEEGWGVIASPGTPGGCWVHFSTAAEGGYRNLEEGQVLELEFEEILQDGYRYRAVRISPPGADPRETADYRSPSTAAYSSDLHITFDDGRKGRLS